MSKIESIVADFRREAEDDFVGLWQIARRVRETCGENADFTSLIIRVVSELLQCPGYDVGQFEGEAFVDWAGSVETKLERLHAELTRLGHEPDIGEIAWIVKHGGSSENHRSLGSGC